MPFKKHKPEEIIGKLREAEIALAQGASVGDRRDHTLHHAGIAVGERIQ
ncbi:hypothetical protein [Aquisediminimonas sediminicola]|nr:hypothetical protein [Aquisediminimonas sediminicola]